MDIKYEAKKGQEIAEEIEDEEIKRGNRLKCILGIVCFGVLALAGLIIYIVVKWLFIQQFNLNNVLIGEDQVSNCYYRICM